MKIGMISFEEALTTQTLRGVFTTVKYLQAGLESVGANIDLLIYGENKLNYPADFRVKAHYKSLEDVKDLQYLYDFIIYFTPGRSWEKYDEKDPDKYIDLIDTINLPFTTIYHSEEYKTHQPYRMNFIKHRLCSFITFISEGFAEHYQEDLEICPDYIIVGMLPPLESFDRIRELASHKDNSVMMTSAWTNFKRNREYFELAPLFQELGIQQYSAGAPASSFYLAEIAEDVIDQVELFFSDKPATPLSLQRYYDFTAIMAKNKQDIPYSKKEKDKIPYLDYAKIYCHNGGHWIDYGAYYPSQLPTLLRGIKYHWAMSCYKKNKFCIPRLEIVTLEALNQGCFPILCKETSPEWANDVFRFSKTDYEIPTHQLKELSDEERISRLQDFYDAVKANLYHSMYLDFYQKIQAF